MGKKRRNFPFGEKNLIAVIRFYSKNIESLTFPFRIYWAVHEYSIIILRVGAMNQKKTDGRDPH